MGTSTRYSSASDKPEPAEDDAAAVAVDTTHHHEDHDHDIPAILRHIRDTLAQARTDLAELLRRSAPPNDHP